MIEKSWSNLAINVTKGTNLGNIVVDKAANINRYFKSNGVLKFHSHCAFKSMIIEGAKVRLFQKTLANLNNSFSAYKNNIEKIQARKAVSISTQAVNLIKDGMVSVKKTGMPINDGVDTIYAFDKYGRKVEDALQLGIKLKDKITVTVNENKVQIGKNSTSPSTSTKTYESDTLIFNDLTPIISVQSGKNLILTKVQGRDYSRKELISGGDLNFTVSGRIVSGYPDIYPEKDVQKFIQIMQYGGIVKVSNPFFSQFNVTQILIKDFSCNQEMGFKDTQPYQFSCVAVEPDDAVEVMEDTINTLNTEIVKSAKDGWFTTLLSNKLEEIKSNAANTTASILNDVLSTTI